MSTETVVVFPLYSGVTQLDFTGPLEVFSRLPGARCVLASVEGGTLEIGGLTLSRIERLEDIPSCAVLCVPGGFGTVAALDNDAYLQEVERLGDGAAYVTSVCTGSLLLAAAGLLSGKRAACHWAWRDLLLHFGVVPDPARVVRDGRVITGGGVTAGIDLALEVVAEIAGDEVAQSIQLALEYAPEPPFDCGRPERADPKVVASAQSRYDGIRAKRLATVIRAAAAMRARENSVDVR